MKYFRLLSAMDSVRDPDLNLGVILKADPFVNSAKELRMDSELTLQSFAWTQGPALGSRLEWTLEAQTKKASFLNEFNAGTKIILASSTNSLATKKSHDTFQMPAMGSTWK